MNRLLLFATLLLTTQLATSCQDEADIRPASYDELAMATGHWEWDTTGSFAGLRTPATEGYSRQLTFRPEGQLMLRRSGQPDYQTSYQLTMGTPAPCGSVSPVPLLVFTTEEATLPNDARKLYTLSQQGGQQTLLLTGESVCLDGGSEEKYHWVAE
ncbi:hypothetical protein QMK33_03285 [Hymenobacter sp. H14-R3]|uniref:hypothetical protein n=1 Tax=Hymenobacter sp. H14-R3 TaxID=3046308 RepID=UPI0024BB1E34|nr:hypothetical protein [Hymenobacter sp. H14-R3]MDJ0364162.1 hypothetical protein [Hymenobacter sp. H14-R3]